MNSIQTRVLRGPWLENALRVTANGYAQKIAGNLTAEAVDAFANDVRAIARHYLAGFSQDQILCEVFSANENTDHKKLSSLVIQSIDDLVIDPNSTAKHRPGRWFAYKELGFADETSISRARVAAAAKAAEALAAGNYENAGRAAGYGADAFGWPIFYLLRFISWSRLGRKVEVEQSYDAAAMGLPPGWYSALFGLVAGKLTSVQLPIASLDDNMRFELRCAEGMTAFTSGDLQLAEKVLSDAVKLPTSLPIEFMLAEADLKRCQDRRHRGVSR